MWFFSSWYFSQLSSSIMSVWYSSSHNAGIITLAKLQSLDGATNLEHDCSVASKINFLNVVVCCSISSVFSAMGLIYDVGCCISYSLFRDLMIDMIVSFPSAHNTRLFIGLNSGIVRQEFSETKDDAPVSTNMSRLTFPHTPDTHIPWAPDLDTPLITAAALGNSPRLEFWFSANSRPIEPASCRFPTDDAVAQRSGPDTKLLAKDVLPLGSHVAPHP